MFGLTPYRRNQNVQNRERDFFDMPSILNSFFNDGMFPSSLNAIDNQMKVDIKEEDKGYLVEAELPGVDKEEINVELNDGRLTIAVERNEIVNDERDSYIRKERRNCSMRRTFYVDDIDEENIKAKFDKGILAIELPKAEEEKRKKKQIKIN